MTYYEFSIVRSLYWIWRLPYQIYFFLFNSIKLWNLEANTNVHTFEDHKSSILPVAFSPYGKYFVSGSVDK